MLSRRKFVVHMTGLMVTGVSAAPLRAQLGLGRVGSIPITIYKSSTCGCCAKWVDHVRTSGFAPTVHDEDDMDQIKDQLGVPKELRSCHTAVVEDYLIEGHVPAADIQRLLAKRPKVEGLAVPGMPRKSPGMAGPKDDISDFDVLAFRSDGTTLTFARY
jgi:hypothetical protein